MGAKVKLVMNIDLTLSNKITKEAEKSNRTVYNYVETTLLREFNEGTKDEVAQAGQDLYEIIDKHFKHTDQRILEDTFQKLRNFRLARTKLLNANKSEILKENEN